MKRKVGNQAKGKRLKANVGSRPRQATTISLRPLRLHQARVVITVLFAVLFAGIVGRTQGGTSRKQTDSRPLRVAVVGFVGASSGAYAEAARAALAKDGRAVLIDPSQMQPALKGVGYQNSLNLSRKEAQDIGAAIGCDFFILGKADSARRSESANETHEEATIGVLIVDSRSGALAHFDFVLERGASAAAAENKAAQTLAAHADHYVETMIACRAARAVVAPAGEPVDEMPDTESAMAAGFKAPEFLNRVKPEYTDEASRADVTATVEAKVIFKATGEVGEIEIVRWAGFGLDESAVRAIRQLIFKPATRDGRAINVRALVRYNFRRVNQR
jgi:TonB family protein